MGMPKTVRSSIEAPAGMEFMVEATSENEHIVRFFEDIKTAKRFGNAFNRKADKLDIYASYGIFPLVAK
jgi:uncharacterized Zn finger protein